MEPQKSAVQGNEFLDRIQNQLTPHLSDTSLSVRKLLRIVFMSRTALHRKLKKEAGMSTTEYIRHSRLAMAKALLLEHPDWSVFRIALEVGFYSQSYFSKMFKKAFGCSPREWKRRGGG